MDLDFETIRKFYEDQFKNESKKIYGQDPKIFLNGKPIKGTSKWGFSTGENIKIPWEDPFSRKEEELSEWILTTSTNVEDENWRDGFDFSACLSVEIETGDFR